MSQNIDTTTTTRIKADPEVAKLAKAEANAIAKHGDKIVEGSAERSEGGKITVLINTVNANGEPDGKTRRVATSDLHQVHHQPEVKAEIDKSKARERRAAKRSSKTEALKQALRDRGLSDEDIEALGTEPAAEADTVEV